MTYAYRIRMMYNHVAITDHEFMIDYTELNDDISTYHKYYCEQLANALLMRNRAGDKD